MTTARVARLLAPRHLVWEDEAFDATPAANEIVAVTEASAISPGTELAAYSGAPPLRAGTGYPRLVGYCNVARVVAAGTEAAVAVGTRIVTTQSHRDRFRIPASQILAVVPDAVPGTTAAVTYLLQLGLAALQRAGYTAGHRVAIVGMGVLGIASLLVARALGAPVTALSRRPAAQQLTLRLGGTLATPGADGALGADIVIDTSNAWNDFRTATLLARKGGSVVLLGFPGRGMPPPEFNPFDPQITYARQLAIIHGGETPDLAAPVEMLRFNLARNMQHLMALIAAGTLAAEMLVSSTAPAARLGAAYDSLLSTRGDTLTVVLDWRTGGVMTISAAVIGCGRMGAATRPEVAAAVPAGWLPLAHADAIAATPALRLDALCDPDAEALRRAAARHAGARPYDDVARMLREIHPVVVTIATRMPARAAVLADVAAAGARAIHCEKPFARSTGEADGFARLLRGAGIAFSYGATRRYHTTYRQAAALVAAGAIGALREIVVGFGAGRLLWTHAHSIDLFLFLSGCNAIDWVQAEFAGDLPGAGDTIDDDPIVRAATLRLANGASGLICELGGCDALIAGTEGTLRILADGAALEHMRAGNGGYFERVDLRAAAVGPSATQHALGELVARIDTADAPGPELEDARIGTHALMAMVESHRRGGARVRLGDVPPELHVTGRVGTRTA